ncbi:MAG: ParB/RepB/Spo0J family partition protein [Phycisphaerae bacterium]|nr:ParB/RepB/Spo0J family partition protein [Phycisphaerae bacterium]MDD5380532.1 ParB/RepB/Spo0J family partition protein [Phycisphaerae bacterium]
MTNSVQSIAIDKLVAHPDNPNKMSEATFRKLVRNIEKTGRYEPIVVRPHPLRGKHFQIINGHHRCQALTKLGYKTADCVVWDIDDEQADILLATLNRLCGTDELGRKLELLKRLNKRMESRELARLVPQTAKQIERLTDLKMPSRPAEAKGFSNPMIFFVNDAQQRTIESALSLAERTENEKTRAAKRSAALAQIAGEFLSIAGR